MPIDLSRLGENTRRVDRIVRALMGRTLSEGHSVESAIHNVVHHLGMNPRRVRAYWNREVHQTSNDEADRVSERFWFLLPEIVAASMRDYESMALWSGHTRGELKRAVAEARAHEVA